MNTKIVINRVYRLFDEPPLYLASGGTGIDEVIKHGESGSVCLINLIWLFSPKSLRFYLPRLRALRRKGITAIVIGSAPQDMFYLRLFGIRCLFANQNQFLLEENIPCRAQAADFEYDAFYAAQAKPFKRMHLAGEVERLYILTYGWPKELNSTRILADFEPRVAHAAYNKSYLDFAEVSSIMHRSSCALALSRKEGAMWAACEALLSGIPVVSTKSKGGRERYFDPLTVKMVQANPHAVAEAVAEFRRNPPDSTEVRQITLEKMMEDRHKTVEYFQNNLLKGTSYTVEEIYNRLFRDGPARTPIEWNT